MTESAPAHNLKDPLFLGIINDLLKHFITLATGAIVLLVGFVEKLALHAKWRFLIAISLLSFTLTVLSAILVYSGILTQLFKERSEEHTQDILSFMGILTQTTWYSFIIGLVALVALALRNLY